MKYHINHDSKARSIIIQLVEQSGSINQRRISCMLAPPMPNLFSWINSIKFHFPNVHGEGSQESGWSWLYLEL